MGDEPKKGPRGEGEDEEDSAEADTEQERPTVAPPFDPIAFAQEVLGGKPSPTAGMPRVRVPTPKPGRPTPQGIGVVRPLAITLNDPTEVEEARKLSEKGSSPVPRKPTPTGALSLVNQRVPSNLPPPRSPLRKDSGGTFAAIDREWDELATRPPPPMQQDLIDATSAPSSKELPPSTKDASQLTNENAAREVEIRRKVDDDDDSPEIEILPSEQEMADRVSLGDYTGALDIAEKLLLLEPDNEAALACADNCRGILRQMYTARIGPMDRVPLVMVPRDQLRWLSIDHRAGFVLSLIDGVSSLDMILDVSGMPELDALRILSELVQQRIISFR